MAPPTITSVSPTLATKEGGKAFVLTGTFDITKTYEVHVGTAGDATDPQCYAGTNKVATITPTSATQLDCFLPELDTSLVGEVLDVFVEESGAGPNDTLAGALSMIERDYSTSIFKMKALFGPKRDLGLRNLDVLGAVDPPKNLTIQSGDLQDAAWTASDLSVVNGTEEDPFGTSKGFILRENAATASHSLAATTAINVVAGQVYTVSVYAKAINRGWFAIQLTPGGDTIFQSFDVTNGVLGSVGVTDTGNLVIQNRIKAIDSVGTTPTPTGWFRCSITFRASSTGTMGLTFFVLDSDTTTTSFLGLNQDSTRVAFPAMDPFPLARAYRETGAIAIT